MTVFQHQPVGIISSPSPPLDSILGQIWLDNISNDIYVFNGTSWDEMYDSSLQQWPTPYSNTIEVIEDPTPLEIVYSYFNRYFGERKDPNVMNDVEDYRFIYAITDYIDRQSSPLTPEGYKQLYNKVRKFIINNEIKDLNNLPENIIILFKLVVLK